MGRTLLYEIKESDLGQYMHRLPNCSGLLGQGFGAVYACDIGKRLYMVGDVIQMENNMQRDVRMGRATMLGT